jgi:hypothetical protein
MIRNGYEKEKALFAVNDAKRAQVRSYHPKRIALRVGAPYAKRRLL